MTEFFRHSRDDGSRVRWPGGSKQSRSGHRVEPPAPDTEAGRVLARYGFTCRIGHNIYEIVNAGGDVLELPFDDRDWEGACRELRALFGQ